MILSEKLSLNKIIVFHDMKNEHFILKFQKKNNYPLIFEMKQIKSDHKIGEKVVRNVEMFS